VARYRQVIKEDGTSEFIEIGTSRPTNHSATIQGDIESFVSPVDGSVITDRKQLRLHNERNNVVNTAEFEGTKQPVTSENTDAQTFARRQEIYNHLIRAEREG
tara:strand:- start:11 stop:319 length:309 start_codon:yes stop_codon:yes gene_type:complete